MAVFVCAESALEHYRVAPFPASEAASTANAAFREDSAATPQAISHLSLVGLCLPGPSSEHPLNVMVPAGTKRTSAKSVQVMTWRGKLPRGSFRKVSGDAYVSSPEFLFLQMARRLPLIPLIELGMELCGTYRRESYGGQTIYDQPALTTPRRLCRFVREAGSAYGAKRARAALEYVLPDSASPLETKVYLLLCLPRRLGGCALPKPELNPTIRLGKRGREHTLRRSSSPDLLWRQAMLDLECHGSEHELAERRAEDSMRRKALERMGVEVLELTYDEVRNEGLLWAAARRIARRLGVRLRTRGERDFKMREQALRRELFPPRMDDVNLWWRRPSPGEGLVPGQQDWESSALDDVVDSWEVALADPTNALPAEYESWEAYLDQVEDGMEHDDL